MHAQELKTKKIIIKYFLKICIVVILINCDVSLYFKSLHKKIKLCTIISAPVNERYKL